MGIWDRLIQLGLLLVLLTYVVLVARYGVTPVIKALLPDASTRSEEDYVNLALYLAAYLVALYVILAGPMTLVGYLLSAILGRTLLSLSDWLAPAAVLGSIALIFVFCFSIDRNRRSKL